MNSEIIFIIN